MAEIKQIHENLWTFTISLPNNPLKSLNCYVIKGLNGNRNLLIDTGMHVKECREDIKNALSKLGMQFYDTDVFLTHLHPDHIGCAWMFSDAGSTVFLGSDDASIAQHWNPYFTSLYHRLAYEGMGILFNIASYLPWRSYRPKLPQKLTKVNDGDIIPYGGYKFQAISTPGHTPGHMCLYEATHKIMILGDHVLFDISPHISYWADGEYLSKYLESLRRIRDYEVKYALPAHRSIGTLTMQERIDQILNHHEMRMQEIVDVLIAEPGLTAEKIASKISWHMKQTDWKKVSFTQKGFAVNETLSHLDCLITRHIIRAERKKNTFMYYLTET